jgi:hypothetical protein
LNVRRVEVEHVPGAMAQEARSSADHEPLLHELALHHRDGTARHVVVVEARVVAIGPRDDPHVDVVVAPQLLEAALRDV